MWTFSKNKALFLDRSFFSHFFVWKWSSSIIISSCLLFVCKYCLKVPPVSKSILFPKAKCFNVNVSFAGYSTKQHCIVEYLGRHFYSKLSDWKMALKVFREINYKLKFLFWQRKYQFLAFRRIFCSPQIQSHFDYGCCS